MPLRLKLLIAVSAAVAVAEQALIIAWAVRPGGFLQLMTFLLSLVFLAVFTLGVIAAALYWERIKWRSLISLAITVLGVFGWFLSSRWVAAEVVGWVLEDNLPGYNRVIALARAGKPPFAPDCSEPQWCEEGAVGGVFDCPDFVPKPCYRIHVNKYANGELEVVFFVGGGFPVKHTVFVYYSGDEILPDSALATIWRRHWNVREHWYRAGD